MSKHSKNVEIDIPLAMMIMVKANVMAYVVTAIFILLGSIVLTYTEAGSEFDSMISTVGILCSAFLAGFDTAKIEQRNGYKWGAVGGAFYFMIFLVLGTLMDRLTHVRPSMILLIALMILVISSVAGIISVNTEHHKKR